MPDTLMIQEPRAPSLARYHRQRAGGVTDGQAGYILDRITQVQSAVYGDPLRIAQRCFFLLHNGKHAYTPCLLSHLA